MCVFTGLFTGAVTVGCFSQSVYVSQTSQRITRNNFSSKNMYKKETTP